VRFLIYISERYGIPIGEPIQKEIYARGDEVRWFCESPSLKESLENDMVLLESVEAVKAYNPDAVLVTANVVPDFFPGLKVQLFHGFSVGKRAAEKGHFNIRGFFDLYCTQGPTTTEPFLRLQQRYRYFDVVETGWPKVDPLFPLEIYDNDRPVIMISSTFTTRLSLAKNREAVAEIARISKLGKWDFIAVLHPKMEQEVVEVFRQMQHAHFTFYDTTDLIPLYKKADVMLSDTTSAITEFALQKKMVVTLNNNQPQPYMINIHRADKIEEAIEEALDRPAEKVKALESFIAQTHPYDDGKSSARVIDAVKIRIEEGKIRRKPLNLIRRFKIRKKLGYWRWW